ncbi:hypothetical protein HanRHA438_Chr07g0307711 [Helianthus annuus]|nr:hypothetical protein HanRHA438_Chr07g0307711 [Helianthus annuus]
MDRLYTPEECYHHTNATHDARALETCSRLYHSLLGTFGRNKGTFWTIDPYPITHWARHLVEPGWRNSALATQWVSDSVRICLDPVHLGASGNETWSREKPHWM